MDIKLNLSYYASIMLNTFRDVSCSKLCWHNGPGHTTDLILDYSLVHVSETGSSVFMEKEGLKQFLNKLLNQGADIL